MESYRSKDIEIRLGEEGGRGGREVGGRRGRKGRSEGREEREEREVGKEGWWEKHIPSHPHRPDS